MQRALFQQSRRSQGFFQIFSSVFTAFSRWGYLCIPIALLLGIAVVIANDTRSSEGTICVNSSVMGTISEAGDVDYWRIDVPSDGQFVVETTGTATCPCIASAATSGIIKARWPPARTILLSST